MWSWPGLLYLPDPSPHKEAHLYTAAHSLHSSPRAGDTGGHIGRQHPGQISHYSEMHRTPFCLRSVKVTDSAPWGFYSAHHSTLCRRVHRQGPGTYLAGKVITSCQEEVHTQPPMPLPHCPPAITHHPLTIAGLII